MYGLTPKLPLQVDYSDGFTLIKEYQDLAHQNLKNLFLTSPGERVMDPEFGVGVRNFLFEQNINLVYMDISERAYEQVSTYMPYVELLDIDFSLPDNRDYVDEFALLNSKGSFTFSHNQDPNSAFMKVVYRILPIDTVGNLFL